MSSECGNHKTVKAILWPWLCVKSPSNLSTCRPFARKRPGLSCFAFRFVSCRDVSLWCGWIGWRLAYSAEALANPPGGPRENLLDATLQSQTRTHTHTPNQSFQNQCYPDQYYPDHCYPELRNPNQCYPKPRNPNQYYERMSWKSLDNRELEFAIPRIWKVLNPQCQDFSDKCSSTAASEGKGNNQKGFV